MQHGHAEQAAVIGEVAADAIIGAGDAAVIDIKRGVINLQRGVFRAGDQIGVGHVETAGLDRHGGALAIITQVGVFQGELTAGSRDTGLAGAARRHQGHVADNDHVGSRFDTDAVFTLRRFQHQRMIVITGAGFRLDNDGFAQVQADFADAVTGIGFWQIGGAQAI